MRGGLKQLDQTIFYIIRFGYIFMGEAILAAVAALIASAVRRQDVSQLAKNLMTTCFWCGIALWFFAWLFS